VGQLPFRDRASAGAILQNGDRAGEAVDQILQRPAREAKGKGVGKHQAFALSEPLEVTTRALRFHGQNIGHELESQDQGLHRVLACDRPQAAFAETNHLHWAPPWITALRLP
jgi:hypothetical protein